MGPRLVSRGDTVFVARSCEKYSLQWGRGWLAAGTEFRVRYGRNGFPSMGPRLVSRGDDISNGMEA